MTTATHTGTDIRIRDAVERWLDWDGEVDASGIGVAAHDGIVTLTGTIDTYAGKLAAERAAKHVAGVRGIANDLEVRLLLDRTDADIARDAVNALSLLSAIPQGVQPVVHMGHVTLTGTVHWLFQKRNAEQAVRHIRGVRGVFNHIVVAAPSTVRDLHLRIAKALHDDADVDARHVMVTSPVLPRR
jgi:osmotically-inducible protein OsmY